MDSYWTNYDRALDQVRDGGATVPDVLRICKEHFGVSSGDAFFPDGADRTLLGVLTYERDDWRVVRMQAYYHYTIADSTGAQLEYVEGDLYAIRPREASNV